MSTILSKAKTEASSYSGGKDIPLGSYAVLIGVYGTTVLGMGLAVKWLVPDSRGRPAWEDLALLALATQRLARLISKDPVTSPLRAPFTRFKGQSGPAELSEEVRGHGPQKAVGELVSCPFCLGQWLSTLGIFGLTVAPRWTRLLASALAVGTVSDMLQFVYAKLEH